MLRVALFDVDGTLVDGHVWGGILRYPAVSRWKVWRLYGRTLPALLRRKAKSLDETAFRDQWVRGLATLLRGWSVQQFAALSRWIATDFLRPTYRQDVVALLEQHREAGHQVILVSTMFSTVLEQIGRYLGAHDWLGSVLEIRDGRLTGRLVGESCVGPRKLAYVRQRLARYQPPVTLDACVAYADSLSDAALLAAVGHPTAVYPEPELRALALAQGWAVHPASE